MNLSKTGEAVCGLLIAAGAAAAWHLWKIDGFIATLVALAGLGMVGHAFGYEIN